MKNKTKIEKLVEVSIEDVLTVKQQTRSIIRGICAGLVIVIPLLIGYLTGYIAYGYLAASAGYGFYSIIYTHMKHRVPVMIITGIGFACTYTLGLFSQFLPFSYFLPEVFVITFISVIMARYFLFGMQCLIFFVMDFVIGATFHVNPSEMPLHIGLYFAGTLCYFVISYIGIKLEHRFKWPVGSKITHGNITLCDIVIDALIISLVVVAGLAIGIEMNVARIYYIAMTCLIILQGTTVRSVWALTIHRLLGTWVGLFLFSFVLNIPMNSWYLILLVFIFSFLADRFNAVYYGVYTVFITPSVLLVVDLGSLAGAPHDQAETIMHSIGQARLTDSLVGCLMALIGVLCIHWPSLRRLLTFLLQNIPGMRLLARQL